MRAEEIRRGKEEIGELRALGTKTNGNRKKKHISTSVSIFVDENRIEFRKYGFRN